MRKKRNTDDFNKISFIDADPSGRHIALLGIAQIVAYGTLFYAFPQIATRMIEDFGWLKSEVYGALTAAFIASAVTALPVGMAIDRGYGKSVMGWGSVAAGLLLIAWSQVESLFWLYATMIGIGAVHSATLYRAAFSLINHDRLIADKKDAITSVTLWGGFASTVFIPLIEFLLNWTTWSNTLIVLGSMNLFLCPAAYRFISVQYAPTTGSAESEKCEAQNLLWALGKPAFWLLLISFTLHSAATAIFTFHLYPILLERDFSAGEVVTILAFVGPAQVGGRVVLKLLKERSASSAAFFQTAAAFPFVYIALQYLPPGVPAFVAIVILYGAANGVMTVVRAVAVPEFLTKYAYGEINGAMSVPVTLAQSVSPAIAAAIWQWSGSYTTVVDVLIVLGAVVAVLSGTVVMKYRNREAAL